MLTAYHPLAGPKSAAQTGLAPSTNAIAQKATNLIFQRFARLRQSTLFRAGNASNRHVIYREMTNDE